ncbi:MAG: YqgE/AlgH family protein [Myxococcota bacterium]
MKESMAPGFLVAPAGSVNSEFTNAVVALGLHETEGAVGFIVNRPMKVTLHELVKDLDIQPKIPDRPVLFGGPVSRHSGFVLYEHAKNKPEAPGFFLCDTVSVSPSRELLDAVATGEFKGHFEVLMGYVGWESHQLDNELGEGGWLHMPFSPTVVFDTPAAGRWSHVFHRLGLSPLSFIRVRGGAQA